MERDIQQPINITATRYQLASLELLVDDGRGHIAIRLVAADGEPVDTRLVTMRPETFAALMADEDVQALIDSDVQAALAPAPEEQA